MFFLLLSSTFISCSHREDKRLILAEDVMKRQPDSAAAILAKISPANLGEKDRALHALLYSMARDKMYFYDSSDSIIRIAFDYYSNHGPIRRLAQALLYMGVARYNARNFIESFNFTRRAMEIFEKLGDKENLAICHGLMAYIYSKNHNFRASIIYTLKSMEDLKATFSPQQRRDCYFSLAVKYAALKEYEKAWKNLEEALKEDLPTHSFHHDLEIYLLKSEGRWEEVKERFREMEESGFTPGSQSYSAMGLAMLQENNADSAQFWLKKAIGNARGVEEIESAWELGYQLALKRKDYDRIIEFREKLDDYHEQEIERLSKADLFQSEISSLSENLLNQKQELEMKESRITIVVIVAVVLILFILSGYWILLERRKKERALKELEYRSLLDDFNKAIEENERIRETIESSRSVEMEMQKTVNNLFIRQFNWVVEFQELYNFVNLGTDSDSKKGKKAISQLEKRLSYIRESFFEETENTINRFLDDLIVRICRKVPNLTENEKRVLVATCAGFAVRTISFLTGQSEAAVENCRSRMKKKILQVEPELFQEVTALKDAKATNN